MTYRGVVRDGVVVPEVGTPLVDGTEVRIVLIESNGGGTPGLTLPPLFQAGDHAKPTGIPDLAINHDHYLYGHPKVVDG